MSRPPTIAQLRARWDDPAASHAGLAILAGGADRDGSPFGEVEGRLDLRGLPVSAEPLRLEDARWEGLDLSRARLGRLFLSDTVIADCRLDRAELRESMLWHCRIEASTLAGANLAGTHVMPQTGYGARSEIVGSDLSGARLSRARFTMVRISDTRFAGANAAGAHFGHCRIVRCDFSDLQLGAGAFENGHYAASAVIPAMEPDWIIGTDFTGADLGKASLWGCQLDDVEFGPGTWVMDRPAEVAAGVVAEITAIPAASRTLGDRMLERLVEPYLRPSMSPASSIVVPAGTWAALDLSDYEATALGILRRAADAVGVRVVGAADDASE